MRGEAHKRGPGGKKEKLCGLPRPLRNCGGTNAVQGESGIYIKKTKRK